MLCSSAQHIRPSSSLPTPCFINTILIPLPTWVLILVLPALVLFKLTHRGQTSLPQKDASSRSRRRLVLLVLYYVLALALIAMFCLEIARFAASGLGIGLLPFTIVGVVVVAAFRAIIGTCAVAVKLMSTRWIGVVWWISVVTMYVVGTAVAAKELSNGGTGPKNYPTSDQVTDRAVIVGVGIAEAVLEGLDIFRSGHG